MLRWKEMNHFIYSLMILRVLYWLWGNLSAKSNKSPRKREGAVPSKTLSPAPWLLKKLPQVVKIVNPRVTIFGRLASSHNSRMHEKPLLSLPHILTKFSHCLKIAVKLLCALFSYHKMRLTSTNLKGVFLKYNESTELRNYIYVLLKKCRKWLRRNLFQLHKSLQLSTSWKS